MTRTLVGLSVPADDTQPVAAVAVEATLTGLRQYVGRAGAEPYLEAIALGEITYADRVYMWADEDGGMAELPANARAIRVVAASGRPVAGNLIVGDVLILGSTDDGAEASLTVDALAWLTRQLGVALAEGRTP